MSDSGAGYPNMNTDQSGAYHEYVEYISEGCQWQFVKRYGSQEPYTYVKRILTKTEYSQYGITAEAIRNSLAAQGYAQTDIDKAVTCTFATGNMHTPPATKPPLDLNKYFQDLMAKPGFLIGAGAFLVVYMMSRSSK